MKQITTQWRFRGKSVRGVSHVEKDLVNQDAINSESGEGFPLILAISDGHGSAKSIRSDIGSTLAVQTATEEFSGFYHTYHNQLDAQNLDEIKTIITEKLAKNLVIQWREKVDEHIKSYPQLSHEQQAIKPKDYVAYGATILTVCVTESVIIYFQLGDGDILCVDTQGNTTRPPIPTDERLIANATTSICQQQAWQDVRCYVQPIALDSALLPKLILVATDGYGNAFSCEDDFLQVGRDYLDIVEEHGLNRVAEELENFLYEASKFSGDDITLGIIERISSKHINLPLKSVKTNSIPSLSENKPNRNTMNSQNRYVENTQRELQELIRQQDVIIKQNQSLKIIMIVGFVVLALFNVILSLFLPKPQSSLSSSQPNTLSNSEITEQPKEIIVEHQNNEPVTENSSTGSYEESEGLPESRNKKNNSFIGKNPDTENNILEQKSKQKTDKKLFDSPQRKAKNKEQNNIYELVVDTKIYPEPKFLSKSEITLIKGDEIEYIDFKKIPTGTGTRTLTWYKVKHIQSDTVGWVPQNTTNIKEHNRND